MSRDVAPESREPTPIPTADAMTPCERCGEPTDTAVCDDCWKAYAAETVKQNVPVAVRQLGWQ